MKKIMALLLAFLMTGTVFAADSQYAGPDDDPDDRTAPGTAKKSVKASEFKDPGNGHRMRIRYWWPGAYVIENLEAVESDIEDMAEAGFGGFELADVWDMMSDADSLLLEPSRYGYATKNWITAVKLALKTAKEYGLTVDLTIGPHWPAVVDTITPNDIGAAVELVSGVVVLESGESYSGVLPGPVNYQKETLTSGEPIENRLLSLQVMTLSGDQSLAVSETGHSKFSIWDTETSYVVDYDATEDITALADSSALTMKRYTAPDDGKRRIIVAMYERGTGQRVNMMMNVTGEHTRADVTEKHSYSPDHFSLRGTQLIVDYWEENLLDDEMRELLREAGCAFFEDSFELWTVGYWSSDMIETFRKLKGYDITPYLPYLVGVNKDGSEKATTSFIQAAGDTEAKSIVSRVRRDCQNVLNTMFIENHLKPLNAWAESLGMTYRVQAYGLVLDSGEAASVVGIIEGEQREQSFRLLAAGRDLAGKTILSDEAGRISRAYSITLKDELIDLNQHYAAGVNQAVLHGYAYDYAPGATWPGFAAFTSAGARTGIAEAWGDRSPMWIHVDRINDYAGRVQQILQRGKNKVDIAIYTQATYANMRAHPMSSDIVGWVDEGLGNDGYTYQYLTDGLLGLVSVEDGVLAKSGPSYKALVVDNVHKITIEAANKLLEIARAGLRVYVVGELPTATRNNVPGVATGNSAELYAAYSQENAELSSVMEKLRQIPNTIFVESQADLPEALSKNDIVPDAMFSQSSTIETVHRNDGDADYYFLFNNAEEAASIAVTFEGAGVPYSMNLWSGDITPVAQYQTTVNGIRMQIDLGGYESAVLCFSQTDLFGCEKTGAHVVSTNADAALYIDDAMTLLDAKGGNITAKLSDGTAIDAKMEAAPRSVDLTNVPWVLWLESWTPGNVTKDVADTSKTNHVVSLDSARAWTGVEGYKSVSGIGTYSVDFTLDAKQAESYAILSIGALNDTASVTINGREAVLDQTTGNVVLSGLLDEGRNELVITVASNLRNVLNTLYEAGQVEAFGGIGANPEDQSYGINGDVVLNFYTMFKAD